LNIEEYIESGNLEQYALGLGTAEERAEVEAMLALHPQLRAELEEIEVSIFQYAQANAVQPSAGLKNKVLDAIKAEATPVVQLNAANAGNKVNWLAAASIALLLGSLAGNFMLYNKYQSTSAKVFALENEKSVLANDLNLERTKYDQTNGMLAAISSPATSLVEMKGLPIAPESKAMIYWNKSTEEVYVSVAALPAPPEGMEYQLWAIVDGAPVDAGMLDLSKADNMPHKMKSFSSAQAFAVTLEKKGGSPTPTMENMYVMGAVPAGV
jgi:anti-sigma-K factor RskA